MLDLLDLQDGACTILYESRTKTRRLILVGGYNEYAQYNRIDSNSNWASMTDPLSYVREAAISINPSNSNSNESNLNPVVWKMKCSPSGSGLCRL